MAPPFEAYAYAAASYIDFIYSLRPNQSLSVLIRRKNLLIDLLTKNNIKMDHVKEGEYFSSLANDKVKLRDKLLEILQMSVKK